MEAENRPPRVSRGAGIVLAALDEAKFKLERDYPGWRVWYVPRSTGDVRWCAQRKPLLNDDSPEHLAEGMAEVEAGNDVEHKTFPLPIRPEAP